jgi:hypothetical protein
MVSPKVINVAYYFYCFFLFRQMFFFLFKFFFYQFLNKFFLKKLKINLSVKAKKKVFNKFYLKDCDFFFFFFFKHAVLVYNTFCLLPGTLVVSHFKTLRLFEVFKFKFNSGHFSKVIFQRKRKHDVIVPFFTSFIKFITIFSFFFLFFSLSNVCYTLYHGFISLYFAEKYFTMHNLFFFSIVLRGAVL